MRRREIARTLRQRRMERVRHLPLAMSEHRLPERDRPWVIRTYAGHSDARRSNELYRKNLAKGQTGLSVAFDLPTQTGYDPDAELARGEVGKVGVSIAHKGDMHTLLDGIPLGEMNTSMTINATAAWLLALYATVAEENGVERTELAGTTQNDIIKEYLSRGTYAFPPGPSMRLIADMVAFTVNEIPKWNPINVCSYHLQEAGATPVQEIAYALSTAMAVLDEVKARGQVADEDFPKVFGRISLLRQRRRPLHRGARQAARDGPALGGDRPQPLRGHRAEVPAPALRRPGQLARPDRVPAREQRAADRARGARRHARPRRPRPRDPAARLERGPRPPPPLGPAVEPAYPADPRQRDRPARLSRHLRGLRRDGRASSTSCVQGARRRDEGGRRARRRRRGRPVHEGAAGRVEPRAHRQDRARRHHRGRPEQVHRVRGLPAHHRRGRRHPDAGPGGRARADRGSRGVAVASATRRPSTRL